MQFDPVEALSIDAPCCNNEMAVYSPSLGTLVAMVANSPFAKPERDSTHWMSYDRGKGNIRSVDSHHRV